MATLPQFNDDAETPDDAKAPNEGAEGEPQDDSKLDGGNPKQAIGYIPPNATPKVKTYLLAAKKFLITSDGAAERFRAFLGKTKDHVAALAMLVTKTIDNLEQQLGPLSDTEHDQVSLIITGWLVSSLQHMGMPGLDTEQGRHDLIGRVLQQVDQMTNKGGQAPPQPDQGGGTLPQMQPGPGAPPDDQQQPQGAPAPGGP